MIRICQGNNFEGNEIDGIPFKGVNPTIELIYTNNSFFVSLTGRQICSFVYYDKVQNKLMEIAPFIEGSTPEEALLKFDKFCKKIKSEHSVLLVDSYDIYG